MDRVVLALVLCLSGLSLDLAQAEEPICFADVTLKAAVEAELWIADPTPTDMLGLTDLACPHMQIKDLTGIEYAANLRTLALRDNWIRNLSPLSGLTNLRSIDLELNLISHISALSSLDNLEELNLTENDIVDISILSGLTHLQKLWLHRNRIRDISPLLGLAVLQFLDLRLNPLDREAYTTHIPQLIASNPGICIEYDPLFGRRLVVTSTAGGSVICPGEGQFEYEYLQSVWLEAKADPGFLFAGWRGTCPGSENPLCVTMDWDQEVRAHFLCTRDVIYVDDDAAADALAHDPAMSDPCENGLPEHPFDMIQEAIDVSPNGATVFVAGGNYHESIIVRDKTVHLIACGLDGPNEVPGPVIDGAGEGPAMHFISDGGSSCTLTGFIITSTKNQSTGVIHCTATHLALANCLIVGNRSMKWDGAAVTCTDSDVVLTNCTIADNACGGQAAGLCVNDSHVEVVNSILWGNTPRDILALSGEEPSVRCSVIAGGWPGSRNISSHPLFANVGYWANPNDSTMPLEPENPNAVWIMGDYHLQSQAGRWDPKAGAWKQDGATSPGVDGGDPAVPVGPEPSPNGGIINLGAYGGTAEASKSVSAGAHP